MVGGRTKAKNVFLKSTRNHLKSQAIVKALGVFALAAKHSKSALVQVLVFQVMEEDQDL